MLVACRLAGLSALGAHYAVVNVRTQLGAACGCAAQLERLVPDGVKNQKIGTQQQAWRRRRRYIVGQSSLTRSSAT